MWLTVLALGGVAVFAGSFLSDDDTSSEGGSIDATDENIDLIQDADSSSDLQVELAIEDDNALEVVDVENGRSSVEDDGQVDQSDERESTVASNSAAQGSVFPPQLLNIFSVTTAEDLPSDFEIYTLDGNIGTLDSGIPPLADWAGNDAVPVINLDDVDALYADLQQGSGKLFVLKADYIERTGSYDAEDEHIIRAGANVYFLPQNVEFPDDYVWSESGAALYNEVTFERNPEDFGDIAMVLRVSTGSFYGEPNSTSADDFSDRAYSDLQEVFVSGGVLAFGS